MHLLFTIDSKNYESCDKTTEKSSIRAIIRKDGKLLLQQDKEGYYKLSGGGPEGIEDHCSTLLREVAEELGLVIKTDSLQEIGYIDEIRADIFEPDVKYICHTYYYHVELTGETVEPKPTKSEIERGFHLASASFDEIIKKNSERLLYGNGTLDKDTEFLKWYIKHYSI